MTKHCVEHIRYLPTDMASWSRAQQHAAIVYCRALVYVSIPEAEAAAGLSLTASELGDVLGVSDTAISALALTLPSRLLVFTLSPTTSGWSVSDGDIMRSVGGQDWSLDVRVERKPGEQVQ